VAPSRAAWEGAVNYVGGDHDGRSGHRQVRIEELRLRAAGDSTKHLPPCPHCHNRHYNTPNGGYARKDPYPDRKAGAQLAVDPGEIVEPRHRA